MSRPLRVPVLADPRVLPIFAVVAPLFILSIRRWEREVSESVSDFRVAAKDFSHGATRLLRSFDLIRQRGADDYELVEQTGFAGTTPPGNTQAVVGEFTI